MSENQLTSMRFSPETPYRTHLTGIQALLRSLLSQAQRDKSAGLKTAGFLTGYRGSPLGGVDIQAARVADILRTANIVHLPGLNEIHAADAAWGTQHTPHIKGARYDGVFSMWYGKGPGADLASDAINHASDAGVTRHGGLVWTIGDDHEAKSSTRRYQSEWLFRHLSMPFLAPCSVREIHDYALQGWALSRFCGAPVGLKVTSDICDASASVFIDPFVEIVTPKIENMPALHFNPADKPLDTERKREERLKYACMFADANRLNVFAHDAENLRFVIVGVGRSCVEVMRALELLGIDESMRQELGIAVVKIGMPWPLSVDSPLMRRLRGASRILVVEEKASFVKDQLKAILYGQSQCPEIRGKSHLSSTGVLTAMQIAKALVEFCSTEPKGREERARKGREFDAMEAMARAPAISVLERVPYFCAGCPHSASTKVPEDARAYTGIGCHYMVQWMDRNSGFVSQMGGEGAALLGSFPFTDERHVFVNMGDGTYDHSGSLAIRALLAGMKRLCPEKGVTVKILFNGVVAMTGGQKTEGRATVQQITRQLAAEGVETIVVISDDPRRYGWRPDFAKGVRVYSRSEEMRIMEELRTVKGVSVLIHDQACAANKRREIKRGSAADHPTRPFINRRVCEGCNDCSKKSNCVAVQPLETMYGRKREIDQSNCNKSFDCVDGFCPSFIEVEAERLASRPEIVKQIMQVSLSEPTVSSPLAGVRNIRLAGIGGTGVSTVEGIFGVAAHLDGRNTSGFSNTGLSQKMGPVTSDVCIAPSDTLIYSTHIPHGEVDLLLVCDIVTATRPEILAALRHGRSHVVVNLHQTPTSDFIHDPTLEFPQEKMLTVLREAVGANHVHMIDATPCVTELFGDSMPTNLFLAGFAYQLGLIPINLESIQKAIRLNGASVEMNLEAFACGRYAAAFPREFENAGWQWKKARDVEMATSTTTGLVWQFARELEEYQNKAYADHYRAIVQKIEQIEIEKLGRDAHDVYPSPLVEAVIRNLFKLMAPKNEQEVGRLHTNGELERDLDRTFGKGGWKIKGIWLAPPFLGTKKRLFGPWMFTAMRVLVRFKFLRGTWVDPFMYLPGKEHRKEERELIRQYESLIAEMGYGLNADNYDLAVQLLSIPEEIRGYGHVKQASIEKVKPKAEALLRLFREKVKMT